MPPALFILVKINRFHRLHFLVGNICINPARNGSKIDGYYHNTDWAGMDCRLEKYIKNIILIIWQQPLFFIEIDNWEIFVLQITSFKC